MKIEDIRNTPAGRASESARGGRAKGAAGPGAAGETEQASFAQQVGHFLRSGRREKLDQMLRRIDAAAGRLGESFTQTNLYAYRSEVAKFLRMALDETYEAVTTDGKTKSGKSKKLMTARLVNERVQSLIDEVLRRQAPIVDYMHRLDEIRGLLVDMYE